MTKHFFIIPDTYIRKAIHFFGGITMSIVPVCSNSNTSFSPLSDNNLIKMLEKQKMQLQEQIQKVTESKMDDKIKQDKVKQLQDQIQQIDMQIQQTQKEKFNQNQNIKQQTANSQTNPAYNEEGGSLVGMSDLIQASATYTQSKIVNSTKNSLNDKGRVLKIEIELDEIRGGDAKAKREELQEIESRKQSLDKRLGETNKKVQNQIEEAAKKVDKNKDTNTTDEDKNDLKQQELQGTQTIYKRVDIKV